MGNPELVPRTRFFRRDGFGCPVFCHLMGKIKKYHRKHDLSHMEAFKSYLVL